MSEMPRDRFPDGEEGLRDGVVKGSGEEEVGIEADGVEAAVVGQEGEEVKGVDKVEDGEDEVF